MRMLISRGSLTIVAAVTLVTAAWAADMTPAQEAAQMLQAEFPQTQIYRQGELVTRIYGQPMTTGSGPEESAELFIIGHAEVFGVQPDELVLIGFEHGQDYIQPVMIDRDTGDYKFYLLRYEQQRAGVPVFRSDFRLLVRNDDGFPLVWAGADVRDLGNFVPASAVTVSQSVLEAAAEAAVAAETERKDLAGELLTGSTPGFTSFTTPERVIWAGLETNPVAPVNAVTYIADNYANANAQLPEKWLFVADAATGEILYKESMILFTDVSGNVQGMATTGFASDACNPEAATPLKYARVSIGSTVAYTDALGNYTIPNGGSSAVTVLSQLWGTWFRVYNYSGSDVSLSQSVTPPGPANFMHNSANNSEAIRAQVNGYVQANHIRDFVLISNPAYPLLDFDSWPVYVNRTDGYCPGNAWYDYSSINFCSSSSTYGNTAFQSVIDHEFGHHLVYAAGSGQDQYGEGMGDVMSVLTADDPRLGIGFYAGNCTSGLRNADNTMQYPCSGEAHSCAGLLSGCVWDLREELLVTEPFDYRTILADLAINAMLLHTGSQTTPQITIDYLTIDDDNGYIGDGTPHYAEIDTAFSAHNMPAPELELIQFQYPNGIPSMVAPQHAETIDVNLVGIAGTPQANSGRIYTRVNGGSFTNTLMNVVGTNQYQGSLPAADCYQRVDFYFSAQTTGGQTVYSPSGAPASYYSAIVATGESVVLNDEFETNLGWTVQNSGLTDGPWERGIPVNCDRGDPPADYSSTGAGYCYLTDNANQADCNTDVDGGYTYLISPSIDLSAGDAEIHYALWYTNDFGADPDNDLFKVYVSNNNGSNWTLVRTFGPQSNDGWNEYSFFVGSYVTPSAQVKVRFEASDLNSGSVVEAGVDDFRVVQFTCEVVDCPGDLDGDMDVDIADLAQLLSNYGIMSGAAYEDGDLDADGDVDLSDLAALLSAYGTTCS